jgi:hypothetical protein
MVGMASVRKIQPEHIRPGQKQLRQHLRRGARRPQCRDDLGAAVAAQAFGHANLIKSLQHEYR